MALLLKMRHTDVVNNLAEAVCLTAAANGQVGVLDLVSSYNGLSPHHTEWSVMAKFYNAVKSGHLHMLQRLFTQGANANVQNVRGKSPLWVAASRGHLDIVAYLVQRPNVDVNSRSSSGRPPIFWPSADGDISIVKVLVAASAVTDIQDVNGETAILIAKENGHLQIVNILKQSRSSTY